MQNKKEGLRRKSGLRNLLVQLRYTQTKRGDLVQIACLTVSLMQTMTVICANATKVSFLPVHTLQSKYSYLQRIQSKYYMLQLLQRLFIIKRG
jgi:hypothetical protein